MTISLFHILLALGGVVLVFVLFPYMKLIVHALMLSGKIAGFALIAFVVLYATGIWRPDLSPLFWLISKLWGLFT